MCGGVGGGRGEQSVLMPLCCLVSDVVKTEDRIQKNGFQTRLTREGVRECILWTAVDADMGTSCPNTKACPEFGAREEEEGETLDRQHNHHPLLFTNFVRLTFSFPFSTTSCQINSKNSSTV